MITYKLKLGNSVIEYSDADIKKVHRFSSVYGQIPTKCTCGSTDIYLTAKSPKGNDYYGVACRSCGAELMFHQKKEGGFYLKQGETFQKWGGGGDREEPQRKPEGFDDAGKSEGVPF